MFTCGWKVLLAAVSASLTKPGFFCAAWRAHPFARLARSTTQRGVRDPTEKSGKFDGCLFIEDASQITNVILGNLSM